MNETTGKSEELAVSKKYLTFYESLREKIENKASEIAGKYGEAVANLFLAAPDIVVFLARLLADKRIPKDKKIVFGALMAYWILPIDLVPEAITGVIGYADDIYISLYILHSMINEIDYGIVREHWPGREEIIKFLKKSLEVANYVISISGKKVEEKVKLLAEKLTPGKKHLEE